MTFIQSRGFAPKDLPTVLAQILYDTRAELERRKRRIPLEKLQAQVTSTETRLSGKAPGHFRDALARPGIGVIAEFKRRSPSAGGLRESADVGAMVAAYERGGASALSVLTEGPHFEGSLDDLRAARAVCELPILRKDFIVDPYQLHEARAAGADAVLLIVAALDEHQLASLHETALELGLDVLVEVHDREELERAASIEARVIGVNNRDLRDFTVDTQRTSRLLGDIPPGAVVVSESGISAPEQLRELEQQGVSAVLVGEMLMSASDPQRALAALLGDFSRDPVRRKAGARGPGDE